jgi:hypothetical protein
MSNMRKHIVVIFAVTALLSLGGCAAESQPAKVAAAPSAPAAVSKAAAGGNSLSKVAVGMTKSQVREIAGSPSDENAYISGKGWIPFYFGNDARRATWFYKGQGRVVFADGNVFGGGGSNVVNVEIDPTEPGTAH